MTHLHTPLLLLALAVGLALPASGREPVPPAAMRGPVPGGWNRDWAMAYALAPWWFGMPAPSISVFHAALSPWGQWRRLRGWGEVWVPRVPPGWRPYSLGGFVGDPRFGWRWVSGEPFGWAVFHYGRWGFDPRLGWFWVPDTAFAAHWADLRFGIGWSAWTALPPPGWVRPGFQGAGGWGWDHPGWVFAPRWGPSHRIAPQPGFRPAPRELERWKRPEAPSRVLAAPPSSRTMDSPGSVLVEAAEPVAAPPFETGIRRASPPPASSDGATTTATRPRGPDAVSAPPRPDPMAATAAPAEPLAIDPGPSRPLVAAPRRTERTIPSPAPFTLREPQGETGRDFAPERMAEQEP